jgi:hypothetical protein
MARRTPSAAVSRRWGTGQSPGQVAFKGDSRNSDFSIEGGAAVTDHNRADGPSI